MPGLDLPCDICRGQCCRLAPMTRREFKNIRKKHGLPRGAEVLPVDFERTGIGVMVVQDENGTCAYLHDGRCSVYDDRPKNCRLYGTLPTLVCAFLRPGAAAKEIEASFQRRFGLVPVSALIRSATAGNR